MLGEGFSVSVEIFTNHDVYSIRRVVPINFFCAQVVRAHFCGGRCSCSSLMFVRLRVAICAEQRDDRKTRRQQSSFHLISSSRRVSSAIAADFTSAPHRILYFPLSLAPDLVISAVRLMTKSGAKESGKYRIRCGADVK